MSIQKFMPRETINIILALLAFGAFHSITAATSVKSFVRSLMSERIYVSQLPATRSLDDSIFKGKEMSELKILPYARFLE